MSNYTKATNFAAKDSLPSGNAGKIIKGTEIDNEYNAIASAISSKADTNSPTFTGTPIAPTAASGTNSTQIATTAFVASAVSSGVSGSFPSGGIILWSGSVANIPSGWVLCNGSNGTPDLRNRFVLGAGSTYAVGATGGSKDAITVAHTHTFSSTSGSGGAHTHGAWSNVTSASADARGFGNSGAFSVASLNDSSTDYRTTLAGANVNAFSTADAHTHSVSGTTDSTGSSGTDANLPPYYALCYIMKT